MSRSGAGFRHLPWRLAVGGCMHCGAAQAVPEAAHHCLTGTARLQLAEQPQRQLEQPRTACTRLLPAAMAGSAAVASRAATARLSLAGQSQQQFSIAHRGPWLLPATRHCSQACTYLLTVTAAVPLTMFGELPAPA